MRLALTVPLIQGLLGTPLKPCQIWVFSLCVQWANRLISLTLFSTGIFLAPLDLF